MKTDLTAICVSPATSCREAIAFIDRNGKGIVLVTSPQGKFLGTVTDGDLRRAILAGKSLEKPVGEILEAKPSPEYRSPVTARAGTPKAELLKIMKERVVGQLPLLDEEGRVVDLVLLRDLIQDRDLPVSAVIMAGGAGQRLRPLTEDLPKPMLPVGDRPLAEYLVEKLRDSGISQVCMTTHYLSQKITDHFGDGSRFGINLTYVQEEKPLGTAGALSLIKKPDRPLLVINGDILTQVSFAALLAFHQEQRAALTVGVRRFEIDVPYGVVESDGTRIRSLKEKPSFSFFVNAGIYLLEPLVLDHIPAGQRFDMTDLIERLLEKGLEVVSFPIREYWLDIGHHEAYRQAVEDAQNGRLDK